MQIFAPQKIIPLGLASLGDSWLSETIFLEGDEYFNALLSAISNARTRVFLESYIFENEHLGMKVLTELQSAHKRGVDVRLLVDGVGSSQWISSGIFSQPQFNFEVRVYHPLPWQIFPGLVSPRGPGVTWLGRLFAYANSRNHRKVCIIDDAQAFVGSFNVSDVHLRSVFADKAWHDVGVCVRGSPVEVLVAAFQKSWRRSWKMQNHHALKPAFEFPKNKQFEQSTLVIRNDGRALRHKALSRRLRMMRQAKKRLWLANAYFVPSGSVLRALTSAAQRGVDVRLLLPQSSDVSFMPWVARAFYAQLVAQGVKVYEYEPRILHAKVMLIDNFATIGSSNLNHRSLLHDSELDVIVSTRQSVEHLQKMFERDFAEARKVNPQMSEIRNLWQKWIVKLLLYFRHML
ncbi:phosphatidylserine/phosphatidylglycerophosphate/cardiolipin synthase family protein [bacterium]|nr:phosphatidylserine/phosphatidylglycerophosphate/cardiolipin synthase family protein [bacterium]